MTTQIRPNDFSISVAHTGHLLASDFQGTPVADSRIRVLAEAGEVVMMTPGAAKSVSIARMTPETARELAATLNRLADAAEGKL